MNGRQKKNEGYEIDRKIEQTMDGWTDRTNEIYIHSPKGLLGTPVQFLLLQLGFE